MNTRVYIIFVIQNKIVMIENFITDELKREYFPVKIDNSYADGHGHTLSIKIVMPCYCQAHCPFCFNNQTINTQMHSWEYFSSNLYNSLTNVLANLNNRKISIDITGNEPTFNVKQFEEFMDILRLIKKIYSNKIDKIVMTTNGFHLYECIPYMEGVVNIVNISLHHFDYTVRREIFGTKYIPSNEDLKNIIKRLNNMNITVTSVAVIYKKVDMKEFVTAFKDFSKELGFKDARLRINFTTNNQLVRNQFYDKILEDEKITEQGGLSTKYLNFDGYHVNIYLGVTDLIEYVIGVELVIDDDGLVYIDYNKRYPMNNEGIKDFDNNIYIIK